MANVISMKQLLEAGVHFGHQTRRWNPKMAPFIFMDRNGIHIIDLQQTVTRLNDAYKFVEQIAAEGGTILFVGTKKQAQEAVAEEAKRCGMYYVNQRWLGGMLTNFQTIQLRIRYLRELETRRDRGDFERLPKKEVQRLTDDMNRLERILGGIKDMRRLPTALFIIDTRKERTAVMEARRLEIPIVALADTNSDPDEMDYPIPANDDAIRAVRLLCAKIADAAVEGRRELEARNKDSEVSEKEGEEPVSVEFTTPPASEVLEVAHEVAPINNTTEEVVTPVVITPETTVESSTLAAPVTETAPAPVAEAETLAAPVTETAPAPVAEAETLAAPVTETAPAPVAEAETLAEPVTETAPAPVAEAETLAAPVTETAPAPAAEAETLAEPVAETTPAVTSAPEAATEPELVAKEAL